MTDDGRMPAVLRHYGADDVPEGYGARWRQMRCPFHEDRTASAAFNEELDSYKCMACGDRYGNAVTLIMRVEGVSAREADRMATEISGIADPNASAGSGSRRAGPKRGYVPPRLRRA